MNTTTTTTRRGRRQAGPTREQLARDTARAVGGPAACLCDGGPTVVARFADQRLVDVEHRHLRTDGCGLPTTHVDPADWVRQPARRRRR
ncbi:hypothetical protein ACFHW1_05050 [Micromonospora sp. LOL_014]|uniref:hypothetical protein n=1 Tax=Micromonospora sp. LOL_014 TaxID=3345415 RepID=UPI003A85F746